MPGRPRIDINRVKHLLSQGCTQTQVAKRLGVAKSVVCMIANGKHTEVRT